MPDIMSDSTIKYPIKQTVISGNTFSISSRYDFTGCRILGRGSYGVVSQAIDTVTKQQLAIKRIRPYANDEWDARHTLREIRLMKLLSAHPNVSIYMSLFDSISISLLLSCCFEYRSLLCMSYRCFRRRWNCIW